MIADTEGRDIEPWLRRYAEANGIPLQLALACAIAEGHLNPKAERYGRYTKEAKAALATGDAVAFAGFVQAAGNDISFGMGQRIVLYHYYGNHTNTPANVLAVRDYTFSHEEEDIDQMCRYLGTHWRNTATADLGPTGGDRQLLALCAYNAGHVPKPEEAYWSTREVQIANYQEGLEDAAGILEGLEPAGPTEEERPMTIEEKAQELTADGDRLGNGGVPYGPVCQWETDAGPMRFQQFWLGHIIEYPLADGSRDVTTIPEGTLTPAQLAQFQGHPG